MGLTPGSRLGPYEILAAVGAGGMGEVYKARDTRLDRTVAIKVLSPAIADDPALRQRLEREARTISALDHPHICALFDIGRDNATDYLVMQYLEGETLASRLTHGALPIDEALAIGSQIAAALAAAHRRGIVHRDLKPGNVMLTKAGAKLLDFGLAKQHAPGLSPGGGAGAVTIAATSQPLTTERTIVGTLQYMSPEQLEAKEADPRSDLFALGAVLYEMLTGRPAFEGESPASVVAAILKSPPAPLVPMAPPGLARLVERCLAKHPEDRWQSASDLAFELQSLAQPAATSASPTGSRPNRARSIAIQLLAVVAAALATVLAERTFSRGSRRAPPPELRLSIVPPAGYQFTNDVADFDPDFAVSPDGGRVVFAADDSRGGRQLWIRDLSSVTPRVLPGTDGARRPFWSHDGQQIGFESAGGLTRTPASGGNVQPMFPGTLGYDSNASWGSSALLLFDRAQARSADQSTGLFVADLNAGQLRSVSRGKHPAGEHTQRYPVLLPDGRHFIYQSWSADPTDRGIYLGTFDSEERTLLVKTGFRAEFVLPDRLVYVKDQALVSQRLSLNPPRLLGDPQVILDGLALEPIPGQATFATSRSGAVLYRSRRRDIVSELQWVDRVSRITQPASARGSDISVTLSPNGRSAAVTRVTTSARTEVRPPGNIWLLDLGRNVPTRLTLDSASIDENPVWSPDGKRIAYASHQRSEFAEVRLTSVTDSRDARVIAAGDLNFHPIAWAKDGRHLLLQAYGTGSGADNIDLWALPVVDGAKPFPVVTGPFSQAQGQIAPNGTYLAYTSDESGRSEVYVRPFPKGDLRWQISAEGGTQPRWRGDSRELYYVSPSGAVMAVAADTGANFTAGVPHALFTEPSLRINSSLFFYGGAAGYDVAADGKRFLVNRMLQEPTAGPIHVVLNAIGR